MASVISRNDKFCVVYSYCDKDGKRRQKWETFKTLGEANTRRIEIEYSQQVGNFVIPNCTTVSELMKEYVSLYHLLKTRDNLKHPTVFTSQYAPSEWGKKLSDSPDCFGNLDGIRRRLTTGYTVEIVKL